MVGVHYIFLHKICSLMEWLNRCAAECMVSFHDAFLQKNPTLKGIAFISTEYFDVSRVYLFINHKLEIVDMYTYQQSNVNQTIRLAS